MTDASAAMTEQPDEKVRRLLGDLHDRIIRTMEEIEAIAHQQVQRVGEETPEGKAWTGFGDYGLFSDVGRASQSLQWEVAAVRGRLTLRGLDSSHKNFPSLKDAFPEPPSDAGQSDG